MGTDSLGRDIYSRVVYGARVSLIIGITVAAISIAIGLFIGLIAGYMRWVDAVVMRLMDGLMAIPAILLAIALVSLFRAGLLSVIVAIIVPEIPARGAAWCARSSSRCARSPYVEAAIMAGTRTPLLLVRHVLPNTIPALIVQGTFICANAILIEAILSFLGIGIPPKRRPGATSWRRAAACFRLYPHNIFFPGICLALTVLAVNVLGDGLRDRSIPSSHGGYDAYATPCTAVIPGDFAQRRRPGTHISGVRCGRAAHGSRPSASLRPG
jgi:peptide/nickel transport system permease protein